MKGLLWRGVIVISGFILIWQLLVTVNHLPNYILPTPCQVAVSLYQYYPVILHHACITVSETLIGLLLGTISGMMAALLLALFKPARLWFLPLLLLSQALPTFAIAPLLVIWLGYGIASKIVMAIMMLFFPVASAFYDGLSHTPSELLYLAKIMNASRWRVLALIQIPHALPRLGSGLRVAAAYAPMAAVISEWVGANQGLGYLMIIANGRMQIDLMFAALTVLVVFAVMLYFTIDQLLKHWLWWG